MNDRSPAEAANPETNPEERQHFFAADPIARRLLLGIFLLLAVGFLFSARTILLPISIAVLFSLVLAPVVRWLSRRGIPAPASASAIVLVLLVGFMTIGYLLSGPVASIVADAPRITTEIQRKFAVLSGPIEAFNRATAEIEDLVTPESTERVVVESQGGVELGYLATDAGQRLAATALSLVLLLFVLASGDLFQEKLIKVLPTLSDKKRGLRIAREIEKGVSGYLFTVTSINVGLGIVVAVVFWLIDMPSPFLWGVATTLANFLPYIGPAIVAIGAFGIGVVAFDTLGQALLAPMLFVGISTLEGQIITPAIVGHRHALNAVVILVSIAFWGWIWGIVGALIAVPMLVTIKVFADNVDGFRAFGEFLGARHMPDAPPENGDHAKSPPAG
jgi:predicted PurR-regulated permease PerM